MPGQPEPFSLEVAERDGAVVLRPRGELDLATTPELEAALHPALRSGRHVVLDLSVLAFLDSSGVRTIVHALAEVAEHGPPARFSVVRPQDETVWRVIEVSGLESELEILDGPPE